MLHTKRLISVLEKHHKDFEWCGYQQGESPYSLRGTFIAFVAHVRGFEIQIREHDYRNPKRSNGIPNQVFCRRKGITDDTKHWIEVTIRDHHVRYGRRSIVDKEVFLPGGPNYAKLKSVFKSIKKVGKFFKPNNLDRLTADNALAQFCEEFGD